MFGRPNPKVYDTAVQSLALFRAGGWMRRRTWDEIGPRACAYGAIEHFSSDDRTSWRATRQLAGIVRRRSPLWLRLRTDLLLIMLLGTVIGMVFGIVAFFWSPIMFMGAALGLGLFVYLRPMVMIFDWNDFHANEGDIISAFQSLVRKNRPHEVNLTLVAEVDECEVLGESGYRKTSGANRGARQPSLSLNLPKPKDAYASNGRERPRGAKHRSYVNS